MSGSGPVLVVAHDDDDGAWAVCSTLRARHGDEAVVAASVEWLTARARWAHDLDGGVPRTRIGGGTGASGTTDADLHGGPFGAVLNRVRWIPPGPFVSVADARYSSREWSSLLLSWLAGFTCPVVNPARPERWLSHTTAEVLRARAAASAVGAPLVGLRASSGLSAAGEGPEPTWAVEGGAETRRFLVAGQRVLDAPTAIWAERGRALVAAAGLALAELTLGRRSGGPDWAFESLDPLPPLRGRGQAGAVADLLGGGSAWTDHRSGAG